MKKFAHIFLILIFVYGCSTQILTDNKQNDTMSFEKNDEDEYDLIVLDAQYDYYLKAIAQPENFYSEAYYKNKNQNFVAEWNFRNARQFRYDPDFYSTHIDYNPAVNYGLHFEYKLYNFFQFINWKYKVRL